MALDSTAFDPVLKDHYTNQKIAELAFYNNPMFAMLPKKKAGGRRYVQPVAFQTPGGGNATFSTAKSNQTNSKYEDFLITRVKHYQLVTVENEIIEASMEREDAFLDAFDEFDRGFRACGDSIAKKLFRTKGGSIGRIDSDTTLAGATIILTDPADSFNFYIGQQIQLSDADGTGSLRDSGATLEVTDIDNENGEITVGANINTVSGAAHNDYIFTEGDHNAGPAGLATWLPTDRGVLSTSLYGVDRSVQEVLLGGVYMDGTGMALDEVLIKLVGKVAKYGGKPSHAFLNPETMTDLMLLWESKKRVMKEVEMQITPMLGFSGFKVNVGGHVVTLYGDRNCPSSRLYVLQMDTWTLWHAGDVPGFLMKRAGSILRPVEDADQYESRVGGYFNLGCSAPGWNGVAAI